MYSRVIRQTLFGAAVGGTIGIGLGYVYGLLHSPSLPQREYAASPDDPAIIQLLFLVEGFKTYLRNTVAYSYGFGTLFAIAGALTEYNHFYTPSTPEFREPLQGTLPIEAKLGESIKVDEDGNFICPISLDTCDKIVCCKIAGNKQNFYQLLSLESFKTWYTTGRPNYKSDGTVRVGYGEARSKIDDLFVITQDEFKRHRSITIGSENHSLTTPVASLIKPRPH